MGGNEHNGGGQLCPTHRKGRMGGRRWHRITTFWNHFPSVFLPSLIQQMAPILTSLQQKQQTNTQTHKHSTTHRHTHRHTRRHSVWVFECLSDLLCVCLCVCLYVCEPWWHSQRLEDNNVSAATPNMINKWRTPPHNLSFTDHPQIGPNYWTHN